MKSNTALWLAVAGLAGWAWYAWEAHRRATTRLAMSVNEIRAALPGLPPPGTNPRDTRTTVTGGGAR